MPAAVTNARRELTDVARAVAGGLLFGVPLLFTMELWWSGQRAGASRSLLVLALTFAAAVVLQRTSGFRRTVDVRWRDAVLDAVDLVGISLAVVATVLAVLREITAATPLGVALGKIVQQALAFTIGAGVAHHYLRESRDEPDDGGGADAGPQDAGREPAIDATVADVGATVIGAVFVALNVAPTDEIPMLHTQLDAVWTVALVATSLAASYLIVFVAGFSGQAQRREQRGILQHPITETSVCYLVSLVCSLGMLAVFGRLTGAWSQDVAMAVILGFPATVGGAAGRLAV